MKSFVLKTAVTAVLMGVAAVAVAKGPPADKGNKPDTEVGNNLSVPVIFAGGMGAFSALGCPSGTFSSLMTPDKDPVFYAENCAETHDGTVCVDEGYYFVQRDAKWQAPCSVATSASALAKWGDNIAGTDAKLKVGSPIRVELNLWDYTTALGQLGYYVVKLEPEQLDRLSAYGHLASGSEGDVDITYAVGTEYPLDPNNPEVGEFEGMFGAIVFDPLATLRIEKVDADGNPLGLVVVDDQLAGGEINATGKIVYGYNLRVVEAGTYRITYTMKNVLLTSCLDARAKCEGMVTWLDIDVIPGGGGGGKKK